MHAAETNRLKGCQDESIAETIQAHLRNLTDQIEAVGKTMDGLIQLDADMSADAQRIESTPGVGRLTARRLVADLPELGQCSPKQIAKLIGLAPVNRDSGTLRGKRTTGGGRKSVRTLLYMPTLVATRHNPVIRATYLRLLESGKPKMVALVACMRKLLILLNAMIREQKNWDQFIQKT